ncbi:hypothetical protein ACP70R_036069 [Stipagrostis hirtigluma subsp. patula]
MPTPVAYKLCRHADQGLLARGVNFTLSGAGVLDTGNFKRNPNAQIELFRAQRSAASSNGGCDVGVAVVVVSGNVYSYAAAEDNGTTCTSAKIAYIVTVVRRLRKRLRDEAGMRKVVVTTDVPATHGVHVALHPRAQLHGLRPARQRRRRLFGCSCRRHRWR